MNEDSNTIIKAYLLAQASITALLGVAPTRLNTPRVPEKTTLPAMAFFTVGGQSTPYIPGIITPSVQFDCWGSSPTAAREVYRTLYDVLQGIQYQAVVVGVNTYYILSAIEEMQARDLQDVDYPGYYRVIATFSFVIRAE